MIIAICPGSYDPIHNGHLDIIKRASMLADKVYVVVGINPDKKTLFSIDERVKMIKKATKKIPNVIVSSNLGLTVDYATKVNASLIIKGYRNDEDLEYELDMANQNKLLAPRINTMLLKASKEYENLSSSLIKEEIQKEIDVSCYLPTEIIKQVINRIKNS